MFYYKCISWTTIYSELKCTVKQWNARWNSEILPNYVEVHLSVQQVKVQRAVGTDRKLCVHLNFFIQTIYKRISWVFGFWYRIVRCGRAIFRRNISLFSSGYRVQLVVRNGTWLINNKIIARNIAINFGLAWKHMRGLHA
jgi:hypothetical protein